VCEGDLVKICALWVVQMCMCERCQTNFLFMSGVANKQTNNLKHRNGGSVISVQYLLKGVWFFFFHHKIISQYGIISVLGEEGG